MIIKCRFCESDFEVTDDVMDGQHVLCPFCGQKSAFSRPARISVPTGARAIHAKEVPPVEDPSHQPPKLRVIRPTAVQTEEPNPDTERKIHIAEENVRFYEELKTIEHNRNLKAKVLGLVSLLVVLLSCLVVYLFVEARKERRHQEELARLEERNRLEAERLENERVERERRQAEEQALRLRQKAEEDQRKAEQERLAAERKKADDAVREAKVQYKMAIDSFRTWDFDFMKAMPEDARPGVADAIFLYLLPYGEDNEVIVCKSSKLGLESVERLKPDGSKAPMPVDTFLSSLEGKDYLCATEGKVYFQSRRKKAHIGQLDKNSEADLSSEFFGAIAPEVKRYDIDPMGLCFEIVFIPKGSKNIIVSETVDHGLSYSLEKVRQAVEDAFPLKAAKSSASRGREKKFKRTTVLWDGPHIKRGVDGVTYVPRTAPLAALNYDSTSTYYGPGWSSYRTSRNYYKAQRRATYTREQWQALYDEAVRQEQQEQEFYANQAEERQAKSAKAQTAVERQHAEMISRVLQEGTLYFRAKIEAGSSEGTEK